MDFLCLFCLGRLLFGHSFGLAIFLVANDSSVES